MIGAGAAGIGGAGGGAGGAGVRGRASGAVGVGGAACVVAIDVGGTLLKGGVCDPDGAIVAGDRRRTVRDDADRLVDGIVAFARDLADEGRRRFGADGVAGVGLAVPGLVDEARGVALRAVNLPWRDLALAEIAAERLGLPVALSHDVRAAAAAEAALGAGRDADDFLFVAIGTGIGAAIVADGRPFLGAHGRAGELGHIVVEPDGPPCACGATGCLEAIASAAAIERAYAAAGGGGESARESGGSAREIAALAQAGDRVAREVWARAARALGAALAAAVALLDPGLIVLGGGLAEAGARLLDPVAAELGQRSHLGPAPRVVAAELGADAGCRGAALLAWRAALERGHTWVSDAPADARAPGAA
jgi:glucokinase